MEEWRAVVGYDGFYSVSNLGRVRSEPREITMRNGEPRSYSGRMLALSSDGHGYLKVGLSRDNVRKDGKVHLMVLTAFVGPKPTQKQECCHNDGTLTNNRLDNLRWDTTLANQHDRVKHGTMIRGEKVKNAYFSEAQVRLLRAVKGQFSVRELMGIFGATDSAIRFVFYRRSWAWLS